MIRAGVITVSDKGSAGLREDLSGLEVARLLEDSSMEVVCRDIVPDEKDVIRRKLVEYADEKGLDLVVTTGGTGVGPRDITPDATLEVIEKQVPGIGEAMRMKGLEITPYSLISRATAGIRGCTLIVNLPGSPKAAREGLSIVLPALPHMILKIKGDPSECAAS
ncbi:MAG: MogA/MoaB family molybdenum cofactor biosynthesis protein [Syntrophales bacterium]|nr:MogA/MoaB family molybdenum cofactor biosynthesis protein [Syntrophales bacterium]MDD5232490.1 MogA/MoaB family molybdenum cofactor biosynthesis protein [Syntrophales bacterium]MDD5531593.1 MogA/MoaB family molybdenum cofactor biosynthesis protein [Syntrophales bacterium]